MKHRYKQGKLKKFFIKLAVYLTFVCTSIFLVLNFQIHPYVSELVKAKAENTVASLINEEIMRAVRALECSYSDIILLHHNDGGEIDGFSVDTIKVNVLRADILTSALRELEKIERHTVSLPLGTFLGGDLTAGMGPDIFVTVLVTDALKCSVLTSFYEAGINQTLHSISLKLTVKCVALLPSGKCRFTVDAECPIGETVLVGKVPDAYTKISRLTDDITESEIDDIYDFGATPN
jgi:sporulation protein YunB